MAEKKKGSKGKKKGTKGPGGGSTGGTGGGGTGERRPSEEMMAPAELIVVARKEARLEVTAEGVASESGADTSALTDLLEAEGIAMHPLFGETEQAIRQDVAEAATTSELPLPDLSVFYQVEAPEEDLEGLCEKFLDLDVTDAAYVKPPTALAEAADAVVEDVAMTGMAVPEMEEVALPAVTPDFTPRQVYLNPAPAGVDARYAWRWAGGRGDGVRVIDVEGAWRFGHEDLRQNQSGVVGGSPTSNVDWENHGTAVLGVFGGDDNGRGVTGICPNANNRAVSIFGLGSAAAIRRGADLLRRGDILLIELHRPGPRHGFQARGDQEGYIPLEFWPDDWAAIRHAVAKGVIVVEAAGNGAENLDDAIYDGRPTGFPADWSNPFRRGARDSGAILVGAGAPPPGTHGITTHGPDRSRLDFSNYGSAVDVQGHGREVTTAGYGQLWRRPGGFLDRNRWYTDKFSGTSSASPVVVGALGCVQGILRRRGRSPLSPARARELLRRTGSPQQDAPGRPRTQRIGNRPNLRQLIAAAVRMDSWVGVQFHGRLPARATRRWFTFRWPAQWHVVWTMVPTTPRSGGPQIDWDVQVERASHAHVTYWLTVTNLTNEPVEFEGRYAVLGST